MIQFEILLLLFAAITLAAAIIFRAQHSKLSHARQTATTLQNRIATLRLQLEAVHESVESEAQLRADAEARLANAEDLANHASIEMTDLNAQFKLAQRNAKAYSDENATLVAELKRTRREIRRLTKALADRDAELNQTRSEMTTPIESNSSLKTQLALAQQEGHEEKTLRLANQTNQKRANRNERSQGAQREEIEAQLAGARRDVKRLTRELRQLQAKLEQEQRAKGVDDQTIAELKAQLSQWQQAVSQGESLRQHAESALERVQAQLARESQTRQNIALQFKSASQELQRLAHDNDDLRSRLDANAADNEKLTRDKNELGAALEEIRKADVPDPEQVARLEREASDAKRETGAKSRRIMELEAELEEANRRASLAVYEHRIESSINAVNQNEAVFKHAMHIGQPELKRDRKRSVNSIREAQNRAGMIETMIEEAVAAARESQPAVANETNWNATVKARIDAGIDLTQLKVAEIISFGRKVQPWNL